MRERLARLARIGPTRVPPPRSGAVYPRGSHTFTAPATGVYRFVAWGAGGSADNVDTTQGASGALSIIDRRLVANETVAIVVGAANNTSPGATTVTFQDGKVVTAGGGSGNAGPGVAGVASGGDVNVNGLAGGPSGDGKNAPDYGAYKGGIGQTSSTVAGHAAGGRFNGATVAMGGDGLCIVHGVD